MPHIAMVHEGFDPTKTVLVRIHSECMTGDLFGSKRCDCGEQLNTAMHLIAKNGGAMIYLRQEGRGIGLVNKLKACNLQDSGFNTVNANTFLGFEADARKYDDAVRIMMDLGIERINLLTNNPDKIRAIENSSIEIVSRIPIIIKPTLENQEYLTTKLMLMGHLL